MISGCQMTESNYLPERTITGKGEVIDALYSTNELPRQRNIAKKANKNGDNCKSVCSFLQSGCWCIQTRSQAPSTVVSSRVRPSPHFITPAIDARDRIAVEALHYPSPCPSEKNNNNNDQDNLGNRLI